MAAKKIQIRHFEIQFGAKTQGVKTLATAEDTRPFDRPEGAKKRDFEIVELQPGNEQHLQIIQTAGVPVHNIEEWIAGNLRLIWARNPFNNGTAVAANRGCTCAEGKRYLARGARHSVGTAPGICVHVDLMTAWCLKHPKPFFIAPKTQPQPAAEVATTA